MSRCRKQFNNLNRLICLVLWVISTQNFEIHQFACGISEREVNLLTNKTLSFPLRDSSMQPEWCIQGNVLTSDLNTNKIRLMIELN